MESNIITESNIYHASKASKVPCEWLSKHGFETSGTQKKNRTFFLYPKLVNKNYMLKLGKTVFFATCLQPNNIPLLCN